ncbi:MAG: TIGR03118 family protein [Gemmatimonadales bacterium]
MAAAVCASALAACHDTSGPSSSTAVSPFIERKLIADNAAAGAAVTDASLVNPWGIAFNATGIMWIADNGSATSTVYDTAGAKQTLVVTIPSKLGATGGTPTGIVVNTTAGFIIPTSTAAHWIFSNEDGTIAAWSTGTAAHIVADRSTNGAVYKGLALAANGSATFLYAANFGRNSVDVFDATYTYVKSFTDSTVAAGYAPFGIAAIGGQLYVTYALRTPGDSTNDQAGAGHGYVDVFNTDGTLSKRLVSNGALNSPWGVAVAPASFGAFGGDVLVGNFGDGHINAYLPTDGTFVGAVGDSTKTAISIDGLWGLTFGPGTASGELYFTSGPGGEAHGLVGILTPKPATP